MASPWLEKKQRMCSSGPCERRFDLRQTGRFNKSARAIIHSNCLLPVLSGGDLKFLVTSFECLAHVALLQRRMLCTRRERFYRRRSSVSASKNSVPATGLAVRWKSGLPICCRAERVCLQRYYFKNTLTPPWRRHALRVRVIVQTSSAQRAVEVAGAVSAQGHATTCPGHFPQVTCPFVST